MIKHHNTLNHFPIFTIATKLDERYVGYIKMDCKVVFKLESKKKSEWVDRIENTFTIGL